MGSAVQRHAAAPWPAWQSIITTLMATTQSPDTDSLFSSAPRLRAQLAQLQTTLSLQMSKPTFQLKPLGAALRLKTTQKKQVSTIQRNIHKQIFDSFTDTLVKRFVLQSQSTLHTAACVCVCACVRLRYRQTHVQDETAWRIRDIVYQSHVSACLSTSSPVAGDSLGTGCFTPN